MNIAIEEDVEDAIVAFFSGKLPGEVDLRPAYLARPTKYPCVVVAVTENDSHGKDMDQFITNPIRSLKAEIQLLTELRDAKDPAGNMTLTIREQCKILRRVITRILSSSTLVAELNASQTIAFTSCVMGPIRRGLGGNEIESTIPLDMIAAAINQEL